MDVDFPLLEGEGVCGGADGAGYWDAAAGCVDRGAVVDGRGCAVGGFLAVAVAGVGVGEFGDAEVGPAAAGLVRGLAGAVAVVVDSVVGREGDGDLMAEDRGVLSVGFGVGPEVDRAAEDCPAVWLHVQGCGVGCDVCECADLDGVGERRWGSGGIVDWLRLLAGDAAEAALGALADERFAMRVWVGRCCREVLAAGVTRCAAAFIGCTVVAARAGLRIGDGYVHGSAVGAGRDKFSSALAVFGQGWDWGS